jgi:hypothetical protein
MAIHRRKTFLYSITANGVDAPPSPFASKNPEEKSGRCAPLPRLNFAASFLLVDDNNYLQTLLRSIHPCIWSFLWSVVQTANGNWCLYHCSRFKVQVQWFKGARVQGFNGSMVQLGLTRLSSQCQGRHVGITIVWPTLSRVGNNRASLYEICLSYNWSKLLGTRTVVYLSSVEDRLRPPSLCLVPREWKTQKKNNLS